MSCCVFMHERKIVVFIIFYVLKSQIFYCFLFSNIQSKTNIVLWNTRHPKTDNLYNLKSIESYPLLVDWRTSKLPCGPESETVSDMLKLNERVDSPPSLFSSRQAPGFGNEGILIVWNKKEFRFTYKRIVQKFNDSSDILLLENYDINKVSIFLAMTIHYGMLCILVDNKSWDGFSSMWLDIEMSFHNYIN